MLPHFHRSYDVIMAKTSIGDKSTVYIFLQYYFKFFDDPELLQLINRLRLEYFPEVSEKNYRMIYNFNAISDAETPAMYFRINKKYKSLINCQLMTFKEACDKMEKHRQLNFEYYVKSREKAQGNNISDDAVNE